MANCCGLCIGRRVLLALSSHQFEVIDCVASCPQSGKTFITRATISASVMINFGCSQGIGSGGCPRIQFGCFVSLPLVSSQRLSRGIYLGTIYTLGLFFAVSPSSLVNAYALLFSLGVLICGGCLDHISLLKLINLIIIVLINLMVEALDHELIAIDFKKKVEPKPLRS